MPPETLKLRQPSRSRLVDDVYRSLEEAILSGRMRPGDRLVETWIAEQLEVSRTTVREALLMLERGGYADSNPRRGMCVTRLAPEDSLDLRSTRALLESFSVSAGYSQADQRLFDELERCCEQMIRCRLPDDVPQLIQIDLAFHRPLAELAGSRRTTELWSSLNGQMGALILSSIERQHAGIEDVVALHHKLIGALRSGDRSLAQEAVIEHYVRADERAGYSALMRQTIDVVVPPNSNGHTEEII
jgi:DNA-binding GntR family transcriptional regulator